MNPVAPAPPQLDRLQRQSLAVGVVGLLLCMVGGWPNPEQFFRSYLLAYVFWVGISLGSFGVVMLHHLTGGGWGFVIRRLLESGTRTFPLMALLFLPLLFGMSDLYVWARPDAVAADEILQHKSAYLNPSFFTLRSAIYFAAWIGVASLLNRWSAEQDRTGAPGLTRRLQLLSGPGLVLYGLTATFASVDWVMSLEPHWSSSIHGILFMVGQGLASLAFATALAVVLADRPPLSELVSPARLHDLGNLLLAFVMFWTYIAFSQFLIIWSGNLPEEIPWYLHRTRGGWQWIGLFLLAFHFALPFLLLLSRQIKRDARMLMIVSAAIIAIRLVDLYWLVVPAFHPDGVRLHWMDLAAPVGIGGLWMAFFAWQLKQRPLVPIHDPRLKELMTHEGGP